MLIAGYLIGEDRIEAIAATTGRPASETRFRGRCVVIWVSQGSIATDEPLRRRRVRVRELYCNDTERDHSSSGGISSSIYRSRVTLISVVSSPRRTSLT